jgi:hypothetical protein
MRAFLSNSSEGVIVNWESEYPTFREADLAPF